MMKIRWFLLPKTLILMLLATFAKAEVQPAHIFGDHMVLQRDKPIKIWGRADRGEAVTAEFHGQKKSATTGSDGNWAIFLEKEAAGGPFTLKIMGKNTVVFSDVLVGEVWICSGQSNMEWPVGEAMNAAAEMAAANFPKIRHIKIPRRTSLQPETDFEKADWMVCSPTTVGGFSAVAYFFAKKIFEETGIPIGLVHSSWGGTICETWMSKKGLENDPELAAIASKLPHDLMGFENQQRQRLAGLVENFQGKTDPVASDKGWESTDFEDKNWATMKVPQAWEEQKLPNFDGMVWFRKEIVLTEAEAGQTAELFLGTIDDLDTTYLNGQKIGATWAWNSPRHYPIPAGLLRPGRNILAVKVVDTGGGGGFYGDSAVVRLVFPKKEVPLAGIWHARALIPTKIQVDPNSMATLLFNGMLSPVVGLGIRGAIWYQGESNVPRAEQYARTFPAMIADWRARWGQGDFPFYFVQLASFLPPDKNDLAGSTWAELRDAQRSTLALPNTGMAVATDIGDANDIHPRNKQEVGRRLALLALKNDFGKNLVASGPIFRSMKAKKGGIELSFDQVGGGLVAHDKYGYLAGFAIAGSDQKFHWARAEIRGDKVFVHADEVPKPVAVRFGWLDNPAETNLFNKEGLPASPFRTDHWKLVTDGVRFE